MTCFKMEATNKTSSVNNNNNGSSATFETASRYTSPPLSPPRGSPPPSLVPSPMSMVSMLGGHPPPFGISPNYPRDFAAREDFAASMNKFMDRSFGESPPPPTVPNNDPSANECKIVEYRGEKIAAFTINGKTMLCLPQAFELFLKHLVGGLHTVYTKLKRLEITPIVCNVEQVRILRGLGAIQPGVNRCKLLGDTEFDSLYKDCTTSSSRPGRPPKRGVPFPPMSPQDAMLHLKNSIHTGSDLYKDGLYTKEPRIDKHNFVNGFGTPPHGINPAMAAQFMALNHPAAAAQAAFLSQGGSGISPFPGLPVTSSPSLAPVRTAETTSHFMKNPGMSSLEALQRSGLLGAAYFERMREGQTKPLAEIPRNETNLKNSSDSFDYTNKDVDRGGSPLLNLSSKEAQSENSGGSEDGAMYPEDDIVSDEDDVRKNKGEDKANNNNNSNSIEMSSSPPSDPVVSPPSSSRPPLSAALSLAGLKNLAVAGSENAQLNNVYGLIGNIQALLKVAVENAKQEERQIMYQNCELKKDPAGEMVAQAELKKELEELRRSTIDYMRRFKKEKKLRRRLQEQLDAETKLRLQMEEALRSTSAEALKRITESLQSEQPKTQNDLSDDDSDDKGSSSPGRSDSNIENYKHQYPEERKLSPLQKEAPSIGFAKNLFPFNGSTLFTSAN